MFEMPKNDQTIMRAIEAQNKGNHYEASCLFREAGNQVRNPSEKQMLWDASKRAENNHYQD